MAKVPPAPAAPAKPRGKVYTGKAPDYVSLKEGESLTGIFLAQIASQFGPAYRFKVGKEIKVLSGNRAQLDQILGDMQMNADDFPQGLPGHLLTVSRLRGNVKTKAGRTVGQYQVEHVFEGCPYGCLPESL